MANKDETTKTDKTAATTKIATPPPVPRDVEANSSPNSDTSFEPPAPDGALARARRARERDSELDRMFDSPADRAPSRDGLTRLRVSTQQGIPSRRRGQEIDDRGETVSAVFSTTPRTVVVDEDNAKIILDDKGLIAYRVNGAGEIDDVPAEAEIKSMRIEVEHLRKEIGDLRTENASLREENRNLRAR